MYAEGQGGGCTTGYQEAAGATESFDRKGRYVAESETRFQTDFVEELFLGSEGEGVDEYGGERSEGFDVRLSAGVGCEVIELLVRVYVFSYCALIPCMRSPLMQDTTAWARTSGCWQRSLRRRLRRAITTSGPSRPVMIICSGCDPFDRAARDYRLLELRLSLGAR